MFDSTITVRGWLGGEVNLRQAGGVPVASFRVACTPRRLNRRTDSWSDGVTQWYAVTAWRALAQNCAESLRRGDPVVVQGRLDLRTFVNGSGVEVVSSEVEATYVGHDLARGVTRFTRAAREQPRPQPDVRPDGQADVQPEAEADAQPTDRPTDQPGDQSGGQPGDQPGERPRDRPGQERVA
jgi:single-strand DNA-binding protein